MDITFRLLMGFLLIACAIAVYFIPTLTAIGKKHAGAIFLVNLFLGWTVIGYLIAFVWACLDSALEPTNDGI